MRKPKPENVIPNPCKDCSDIQLDDYGYLCDLSCGKRTAYLNQLEGAKAMQIMLAANFVKIVKEE